MFTACTHFKIQTNGHVGRFKLHTRRGDGGPRANHAGREIVAAPREFLKTILKTIAAPQGFLKTILKTIATPQGFLKTVLRAKT